MLTLPFSVPEAALTDRESRRLARLTREVGGIWLRAVDGQPEGWPAATHTDPAALALPVAETPVFVPHRGRAALHLATGANRGFRLPEAVPDPSRWSAALLWAADEPALALLAVRPERGGNPLHLSDTEEGMVFRDDDGTASATLPRGQGPWRLTVLACSGGGLTLAQDGRQARAQGLRVPPGAAHLLVGHRSLRPGMRKTLGAGRIAGVWLWPDLDILSDAEAAALREALDGFRHWEI